MIGLIVMLVGFVALVFFASVDVAQVVLRRRPLGDWGMRISSQPNINLLIYPIPYLLGMFGLALWSVESGDPFLLDAFGPQMFVLTAIPVTIPMVIFNIVRFQRGTAQRHAESIYSLALELLASHESPEQGVDAAIEYVEGCSEMFRVSVEEFVRRLRQQDETIGTIAERRARDRSQSQFS